MIASLAQSLLFTAVAPACHWALMQGNGWRASEWLGVITAGALWTPLHEEVTMQQPGHTLRGRMLAAQGKKAEAEAAFEEAIEVSHRTGLRLLEMFALRDLKKHVLDGDGRGEEGILGRQGQQRGHCRRLIIDSRGVATFKARVGMNLLTR